MDDDEDDDNNEAAIRQWACKRSLESPTIGFDMPNDKLVWNHLGRFRKLRSLTFAHPTSPLEQGRRGLVTVVCEVVPEPGCPWIDTLLGGG